MTIVTVLAQRRIICLKLSAVTMCLDSLMVFQNVTIIQCMASSQCNDHVGNIGSGWSRHDQVAKGFEEMVAVISNEIG